MTVLQQVRNCGVQRRSFWAWLNIVFNQVDNNRKKEFGADRTCAEWVLRNGGAVRWKDTKDILSNYNALPPEGTRQILEEVDATGSSIMHYGFDHFVGCQGIQKVILHNCEYLQNPALGMLSPINPTLRHLQVSACKNITQDGLMKLKSLTDLKMLILFDFPYVNDKKYILEELTNALPKCDVTFK